MYGLISSACPPILVGVVSPVSEISLLSKTAKFPFPTMDYSPWSSKNLIDRNQFKKFMQVLYGLTSSAYTSILVCIVFPVLEILLLSIMAKFPFPTMDYSPWSSKNLNDWNQLKKFMHVGIDVKCMHTNFGGVVSPVSEILLLSKMAKFPFPTMDYYSPWSSKNLIDRNQLKKFLQVWIDVKCIHTNFGGCGLSGFGDIATLKNGQISLSNHGLYHIDGIFRGEKFS